MQGLVQSSKHVNVPPREVPSQGVNGPTVTRRLELVSIGALEGNGLKLFTPNVSNHVHICGSCL